RSTVPRRRGCCASRSPAFHHQKAHPRTTNHRLSSDPPSGSNPAKRNRPHPTGWDGAATCGGYAMSTGATVSLSTIPTELTTFPQWVVWRWGAERNGRREKVPHNARTGQRASVSNSHTWSTFAEAARVVQQYDGLGFVLTQADPFVGVDLDHCRD